MGSARGRHHHLYPHPFPQSRRRGPIAGIGISFIMTGLLLKSLIPLPIQIVTPWPLPDVATGLALGTELPSVWPIPIIATVIWIVVMTAVALWRFGHEEF